MSSTQLAATVARDEPSAFLEANRSVVPIRNPVAKSVQVSPLRRCATTSRACSDLKAPTPGSSLGAPVAQRVGQHDQRAVGHGHTHGVGSHPKLLVGRVDLSKSPVYQGFACLQPNPEE